MIGSNPVLMKGFDPNALQTRRIADAVLAGSPCQGFSAVDPFAGGGTIEGAVEVGGNELLQRLDMCDAGHTP